jgi:hypothetical protein
MRASRRIDDYGVRPSGLDRLQLLLHCRAQDSSLLDGQPSSVNRRFVIANRRLGNLIYVL